MQPQMDLGTVQRAISVILTAAQPAPTRWMRRRTAMKHSFGSGSCANSACCPRVCDTRRCSHRKHMHKVRLMRLSPCLMWHLCT